MFCDQNYNTYFSFFEIQKEHTKNYSDFMIAKYDEAQARYSERSRYAYPLLAAVRPLLVQAAQRSQGRASLPVFINKFYLYILGYLLIQFY